MKKFLSVIICAIFILQTSNVLSETVDVSDWSTLKANCKDGNVLNVTTDITGIDSIAIISMGKTVTIQGKSLTADLDTVVFNNAGNFTLNVSSFTGTITTAGRFETNSYITAKFNINTYNSTIVSSGTITAKGFLHNMNNCDVQGNGTFIFDANCANNGTMEQEKVVVNTAVELENNKSITAKIENNGTIKNKSTIYSNENSGTGIVENSGTYFLKGNNSNIFIGAGTLYFQTAAITNSANISQNTVINNTTVTNSGNITGNLQNNGIFINKGATIVGSIENNGEFEANGIAVIGGDIKNNGKYKMTSGDNSTKISGTGELLIVCDSTNTATIDQSKVTIRGNIKNEGEIIATNMKIDSVYSLESAADKVKVVGGIENDGTYKITSSTNTNSITGNGTTEVSGNVVSSGRISNKIKIKSDATLNISADNVNGDITNSGTLKLDSGRLQNKISNGNLIILGDVSTIAENLDASVIDNTSNLTLTGGTLSQDISGTGTTIIDGVGVKSISEIKNNIVINSAKDLTIGATNIKGDVLNNGTLNIGAGTFSKGVLGTGTVKISSGTTLSPGNSVDTITFAGNLDLLEGSNTIIEVSNDNSSSDKIIVNNDLTIADNQAKLKVENLSGKYFEWKTFDIVEYDGNYNEGKFVVDYSSGNSIDDKVIVELDYTEDGKIKLIAKRKSTDYKSIEGLSHNEKEVATAIDNVSTGFGGDITTVLLKLEELAESTNAPKVVSQSAPLLSSASNSALKSAFKDMSGNIYANAMLANLLNVKTPHVYDRIENRCNINKDCKNSHSNIWGQYYNSYDEIDKNSNSEKVTNNSNGVLVGYDKNFTDSNWLVGVYAGYGTNKIKESDDKVEIDNIDLGGYAGYKYQDWLFKGTLLLAHQGYKGTREISFMNRQAESDYNGASAGLDLQADYLIPINEVFSFRPFAGILQTFAYQESFKEKGADSLNLEADSQNNYFLQLRLGAQANADIKKFHLHANVAVKQFITDDYSKINTHLSLPNTDMNIYSAEIGKTGFAGGIGASYDISKRFKVFANGETSMTDKWTNYYGNIGISYAITGCFTKKKKESSVNENSKLQNENLEQQQQENVVLEQKESVENNVGAEQEQQKQETENNIEEQKETMIIDNKTYIIEKSLSSVVLFDVDKDEIKEESINTETFEEIVKELKEKPNTIVIVEGHTDNAGTEQFNNDLSKKRAEKVAEKLNEKTNQINNIKIVASGFSKPIVSNDTEEGKAKNRRVDIKLAK